MFFKFLTILFLGCPTSHTFLSDAFVHKRITNTCKINMNTDSNSQGVFDFYTVFNKNIHEIVSTKTISNNIIPTHDIISDNVIPPDTLNYLTNINDFDNKIHLITDDVSLYLYKTKCEIGYNTIKLISSILPHIDSIGHRILHLDNVLINDILNLTTISPELKKDIVLNIIKLSQQGDNFGTHMLQLYYDMVDKLMY